MQLRVLKQYIVYLPKSVGETVFLLQEIAAESLQEIKNALGVGYISQCVAGSFFVPVNFQCML